MLVYEDVKREMGRRIQERRRYLRLTQKEMAVQVGVERNAYARWETGENGVPSALIPLLARALGVSIGWLYGEEPPEVKEDDLEILAYYHNQPEPIQEMARRVLREMFRQDVDFSSGQAKGRKAEE